MDRFLSVGRWAVAAVFIFGSLAAIAQPGVSFTPDDGDINVNEGTTIVIDFTEPIRSFTDMDINGNEAEGYITLKLGGAGGADIDFSATINAGDDQFTIVPDDDLPSGAVIYVAIADIEAKSDDDDIADNPTTITFTVRDYEVPGITFTPANSTTNVALNSNLVIDFTEAVRNIDNSDIDDDGAEDLVTLKLTDALGADVTFTAVMNAGNDQITINPTPDLVNNQTYYLSIAPVEDAAGNATVATNITFSTPDTQAPVAVFLPVNGATSVSETGNITITFLEAIRRASDNANLTDTNIDGRIVLKLGSSGGADIDFDATIDGADKVITINPTDPLPSNSTIYVAITGVEDASNNLIAPDPSFITFTTGDTQGPVPSFNPDNGDVGISVSANLIITFDEAARDKDDDLPLTPTDLNSVIELKVTNNAGTAVPFTASIDATNKIITVNPNANLLGGQLYYVEVNPVEDGGGNLGIAKSITFTTETAPTITNFRNQQNAGTLTSACVNDNVIINGTGFGSTNKPTVTINGAFVVDPADVTAFSATQITFRLQPGAPNGTIVVTNNDNGLASAASGSSLTVLSAINTGLAVTLAPPSPAQGDNVTMTVVSAQSNLTYTLILDAFTGSTPAPTLGTKDTDSNNANGIDVVTGVLGTAGEYDYRITAGRTECVTRNLTAPLIITIADLTARAGVPKTVCNGDSVVLGSVNPPTVQGGTGFYQIKWYKLPSVASFSSVSNPVIKPTATGAYRVVVNDNGGHTASDTVVITVNQPEDADNLEIILNPSKPNNTYQREQTDPVILSYELNGAPGPYNGTTHFEGQGVNTNDNPKKFYPNAANSGGNQIDLYYENAAGCITKDSIGVFIRDQNLFVTGLDQVYCRENLVDNVTPNTPVVVAPVGFSFCFLGPCQDYTFFPGRRYTYLSRVRLRNGIDPLNDTITNTNAFQVVGGVMKINTEFLSQGVKQLELYYQVETLNYSSVAPGYVIVGAPYKEFVTVQFDVLEKPLVFLTPIPDVCVNQAPFVLGANPPGGTFRVNGSPATNNFNPATVGLLDDNTVVYTYTDPSTTCSNTAQTTIHINRIPGVDIIKQDGCVGELLTFMPKFSNPQKIPFTYSFNYDGNSPDTTVLDTAAVALRKRYEVASTYPLALDIVTNKGCVTGATDNVIIGTVPDLKLSWYNVCDGDATRFAFKSNFFNNSLSAADSIIWSFGSGTPLKKKSPVLADSTVDFTYASAGYFTATVTLTTDLNCQRTDEVSVFKVKKEGPITDAGYYEDFNDALIDEQGWKNGGTNSSWAWGDPAGVKINDDSAPGGGKAWVTNLSGPYNINEDSWVHSPCFDLSQIQRPALSVDIRSLTFDLVDGAVLQYNIKNTTNRESDWKTVGTINSGKNWYNRGGIAANPGNQSLLQLGWSGKIDSLEWRNAIIPLDNILNAAPPLTVAEKSRMRFRFAFASSEFTPDGEGFAFDNFRISQRDRIVLLEQFTNNGGPNNPAEPNKVANNAINAFLASSSGEVIKLEYHLGVNGPDTDPIYDNNSIDANARAAFYGVTSTPTPFIDARSGVMGTIFGEQTLKSAEVSIDVVSTPSLPADMFNVSVKFTAKSELPKNTVLHIAVIEKQITHADALGSNGETQFSYVMKKMLPDALGTRYPDPIPVGGFREATYSWSPQAYNFNQLAVIAFVQNEDTKEVYQARILTVPTHIPDPAIVTGTEPSFEDQIKIYPNPANAELTVLLPRKVNQVLPVSITDGIGREVYTNHFVTGEQQKTVKTSDFVPGVYILKIKSANGEVARKKIMILHH